MESQPQNPEFRINPDNFHPCVTCSEVCVTKAWQNCIFMWPLGSRARKANWQKSGSQAA